MHPLPKTELLDDYICQVCKDSGFPLWGNRTAPNYVHNKHFEVLDMLEKTLKKEVNNFVVVDWLYETLKAGNQDPLYMLSLEYLYGFGVTVMM